MWGSGMKKLLETTFEIQNQEELLTILSSEIQVDCRDFSILKLYINKIRGSTKSSTIRLGSGNLSGECRIESVDSWVSLLLLNY